MYNIDVAICFANCFTYKFISRLLVINIIVVVVINIVGKAQQRNIFLTATRHQEKKKAVVFLSSNTINTSLKIKVKFNAIAMLINIIFII